MIWQIILIIAVSFCILVTLSFIFYKKIFKRVFDIILSFFAIIILSPLFLVLSCVGAIDLKGNPFFVQERPGKNGKIFKLIKFRSMRNDKNESGDFLDDSLRLTKYGLFLRKTSLDELPELFNIFIGDMSFVGPRPLLVDYMEKYNSFQLKRHNVKPGLTGLAQINGRNLVEWEKKFELDVFYVDNYSLILDLIIILKTIFLVISGKGVSSEKSLTMERFEGNKE